MLELSRYGQWLQYGLGRRPLQRQEGSGIRLIGDLDVLEVFRLFSTHAKSFSMFPALTTSM